MRNCEKTAKLLKLASENPELPIIFEVDNEVVPNDEYGWYLGSMSSCRVGEYAIEKSSKKDIMITITMSLMKGSPEIVEMRMRNLKNILIKLQMKISKQQSLFQYLLIRNRNNLLVKLRSNIV